MISPASVQHPGATAEAPWLGLESYREQDAHLFHGREKQSDELLRMVKREALTVIFGPSGIGKTSLLRAGLFPRLSAEKLMPVYVRLIWGSSESPARQIRRSIEQAALRFEVEMDFPVPLLSAPEDETLWEYLHRVELWDKRNQPVAPVLFFDQFEELFTLGQKQADAFLAELTDLAENYLPSAVRQRLEAGAVKLPAEFRQQHYKIVLSLREDFVHLLDAVSKSMPSIMQNRYALAQMNGAQALDAVAKPGAGIVDESVADSIVHFVAAANIRGQEKDATGQGLEELEVEPALLSVVCRELNARRLARGEPAITIGQVESSRGDILDDFYQRTFEKLPPAARIFVEERLLTGSGFRSTAPVEDATRAGLDDATLGKLVDRRLLRIEPRLGIPHVELTHDLLTKVVQSSRDRRHLKEQLSAEQQSRQAQEKFRQAQLRTARRVGLILAAGLVGALLLAAFALYCWRQADHQTSIARAGELAAYADQSMADDPELSLILSRYAVLLSRDQGPDALMLPAAALHSALLSSHVLQTLRLWGGVQDLSLSGDGKLLAAAGFSNSAVLWDTTTWTQRTKLTGSSVSVNMDGSLVAVSAPGVASVYRPPSPASLITVKMAGTPAIALSPDGKLLATGGSDPVVRLWDVASHSAVRTLEGHAGRVTSLSFSRDGKLLASGSEDMTARIWDLGTGKLQHTLSGHAGTVEHVAFSFDGSRLATASSDQTARIWDVGTGDTVATLQGHADIVRSAAFSPDGHTVATVSNDNTSRLWDPASGVAQGTWRGQQGWIDAVAFLDNTRLVTGAMDGTAKVIEADFGPAKELARLAGHAGSILAVAFSPDGKTLATTGSGDNIANLWNLASGKPVVLAGHTDSIHSVAFSQDGSMLATASFDATIRTWDVKSGRPIRTLAGHSGPINAVAFSPDGRQIASGSDDGTVKIWDVASGDCWKTLPTAPFGSPVVGVAFLSDGKTLAVAMGSYSVLLDIDKGEILEQTRSHPGLIFTMALNRDGDRMATSGNDYTTVVAAINQKTRPVIIADHTLASGLAFSPDGNTIATGGPNGVVKVWDLSGRLVLSLPGHRARVNAVAFSPDGKQLASVSDDMTTQVYALDPGELLGLAAHRITRKLSRAECQKYFHGQTCPAGLGE